MTTTQRTVIVARCDTNKSGTNESGVEERYHEPGSPPMQVKHDKRRKELQDQKVAASYSYTVAALVHKEDLVHREMLEQGKSPRSPRTTERNK
jgi:hypothetical protein